MLRKCLLTEKVRINYSFSTLTEHHEIYTFSKNIFCDIYN